MKKNFFFHLIAFCLLLSILVFFNKAYRELITYSELTNRTNIVYSSLQNLSKQINNAAILNPDLLKASDSLKGEKLFFTDNRLVTQQLELLKSTVKDSANIRIVQKLDVLLKSELAWLLNSNVPDSIINHRSLSHIAALQKINSLIDEGIERTNFLLEYRKSKLDQAISDVRTWMIIFISISVILLLYITLNLFRQRSITKIKEGELEKSEKRFRALVENSTDIIAMLDKDRYPLYRSPSAERLTGYLAEERKGGVQLNQIHPEDMEAMKSCLEEITNNPGKVIPITYRIKHKDGHYIWLEGTFTNMFHDPGVDAIVVNMRDITTRKDAEEKVIEAYKEKDTVLNRINDAVVSVDNQWRYTYLNDAAMVAHPMGRDKVLGKVIWDVHPEMEGTIFQDKYHEAMLTKKVVEVESYYQPMDIWFFVKVYPSADGLTIFYKDITESKKADQELSRILKDIQDYKYALDESSIVAITDQKGIIMHANDNFCEISKYSREELIGQDHRIVNSAYHSKEFIRELWTTIANGKIWKGDIKNKAKDGSTYWVETTIVPFLNKQGKPYQYVAIRADITQRKATEESLHESLKEITDYKFALDESSIVAITDQKGIIQYANDNFCKISKYSREELIGQDHRIINSGYHPKEFIRDLWTTIAHGKIWKGELKNKAKNGDTYWVDTTIVPFLNEDGKPYQYVAIRADITQRKAMEESLQESLKEIIDYKYALDESSIVAITDQKGIIKYANDNFCQISKYSRKELIGKDHRIINSDYHPKEFIRDLWTTIANGKIWSGDIKNKAKDGSTYWVETTIVPFLNEHGKPYQYVAIRADITQRKKTEEELSKNIYELERSNKELEQFAYIASHDLQEPLRMVGSYMQLIERRYKGKLDKDADEFIHYAVDGANRMKHLISDLLNYSRMNKEGVITTVNMGEVMKEVVHNLSASIKDSGGNVNCTEMPSIEADRTQMLQLFQNLISNALKFNKEGVNPEVEIKAEKQDKKWLFSIMDNGIGIERQYSDRIFIIFKQLHSKAQYSGTGIGLAIAKKIVERHGGNIWFESDAGKGTTFYFTLNAKS